MSAHLCSFSPPLHLKLARPILIASNILCCTGSARTWSRCLRWTICWPWRTTRTGSASSHMCSLFTADSRASRPRRAPASRTALRAPPRPRHLPYRTSRTRSATRSPRTTRRETCTSGYSIDGGHKHIVAQTVATLRGHDLTDTYSCYISDKTVKMALLTITCKSFFFCSCHLLKLWYT